MSVVIGETGDDRKQNLNEDPFSSPGLYHLVIAKRFWKIKLEYMIFILYLKIKLIFYSSKHSFDGLMKKCSVICKALNKT